MLGLGNTITTRTTPNIINDTFLPTDVSNLQLWLKNNTGLSNTTSGGSVETWNDSSGNENNISQSTSADMAVFDTGGLHFSGSTDHYDLTDDISIGAEGSINVFAVLKVEGANSTLFGNTATSDFIELQTHKQLRFTFDDATAEKIVYPNNTLFNTTTPFKSLYHFQRTAGANSGSGTTAQLNLFMNGGAVAVSSYPSGSDGYDQGAITIDSIGTRTGSDRWMDGTIYELLIFSDNSSDMASQDIAKINSYLLKRHGEYI